MVLTHNMTAMNAQRQYKVITNDRVKNSEKLSSGYKINRAADDAAGLTISEKMRSQIRGLTQASDNAQDGVSFIQIADGALTEVHTMLDRMVELTVKASNGTNTTADRDAIQKEITQLTNEINRVHQSSEFNTIPTFCDDAHSPEENFNVGPSAKLKINDYNIELEYVGNDGTGLPAAVTATQDGAATSYDLDFANYIVAAAQNAVSRLADTYPGLFNASSNVKIGLNIANIDGSSGTLASAALSMSWNSVSSQMEYKLNIDSSDYNASNYTSKKEDLAATIAHEMTHVLMYDTLTSKMIGNDKFPKWFVEGAAQTASGDGGWVHLNGSSSDASIKSFMSQIGSNPYGAGYLATMSLGAEIAKAQGYSNTDTGKNIRDGLNKLFDEMTKQSLAGNPIDPDAAINTVTNGAYKTFAEFQNKFKSGNQTLVNDIKNILTATGSGAGSLLDGSSLSDSQATVFNPASFSTSSSLYAVDKDHKSVTTAFGAGLIPGAKMAGMGSGRPYDNGDDLILQVGAADSPYQQITLKRFNMSADSIFNYEEVDCSTQEKAQDSMQVVNDAIARVSKVRSYYGAVQNRLEHTIANLDNIVENTTAAESQIRDTDMAAEMVKLSKNNILTQVGESMMAQANQSKQGVLSLLQG